MAWWTGAESDARDRGMGSQERTWTAFAIPASRMHRVWPPVTTPKDRWDGDMAECEKG